MIRVGVIGGAGYVAGELLRILIHHSHTDIVFVQSSSQASKKVTEIHQDLIGDTDLDFINDLSNHPAVDVIFLCGGHGQSKLFLTNHNIPKETKIIDLSTDFRMKSKEHLFVYGLPELNRKMIRSATRIANPGCFATGIQLGLLPLAANNMLKDDVHVHAITGSTGAGIRPSATTHFSWRNNNVSIYKAFTHQHLDEITQSIKQLDGKFSKAINFLPVRGNFARGIYASIYTKTSSSEEDLLSCFNRFYKAHPFVIVTKDNVNLKQVVNTNKAVLQVQKIGDKVLIISMIDNLLKGAAGQAVHNLNLMFGLEETMGLHLKSLGF